MRIEASQPKALPAPVPAATPLSAFRAHVLPHRLGAPEARTLLGNAWTAVTGNPAEPRTSALLTAHWALETDSGRCMPGHNFAGIKAAPGAAGQSFSTIEGHGATRREVSARFRVYESAEAGARDYVTLLATRYPDAVAAARAGDSAGFARALAHGGYFTAVPESYAAGLEHRLATLEARAPGCATASCGVLARAALDGVLHAFRAPADDG
ncbi:MAG: glucosaminidase domain-containing protein [Pseudomonadota bacterium]